jgi:septation ring formation regulator EzrA
MAYDTIKDKLSSISWSMKRIADSLDELVDLKSQQQQPINKIRDKYQARRIKRLLEDRGVDFTNTEDF